MNDCERWNIFFLNIKQIKNFIVEFELCKMIRYVINIVLMAVFFIAWLGYFLIINLGTFFKYKHSYNHYMFNVYMS